MPIIQQIRSLWSPLISIINNNKYIILSYALPVFQRTVGTLFSLHPCNSHVTNAFQRNIFNEFT